MSTGSLIHLIAGMAFALLVLTACGGAIVSGDTLNTDGLGPRPRPNHAQVITQKDLFQEMRVEAPPGIRLDTAYGEILISAQPEPMAVMLSVSTDI